MADAERRYSRVSAACAPGRSRASFSLERYRYGGITFSTEWHFPWEDEKPGGPTLTKCTQHCTSEIRGGESGIGIAGGGLRLLASSGCGPYLAPCGRAPLGRHSAWASIPTSSSETATPKPWGTTTT